MLPYLYLRAHTQHHIRLCSSDPIVGLLWLCTNLDAVVANISELWSECMLRSVSSVCPSAGGTEKGALITYLLKLLCLKVKLPLCTSLSMTTSVFLFATKTKLLNYIILEKCFFLELVEVNVCSFEERLLSESLFFTDFMRDVIKFVLSLQSFKAASWQIAKHFYFCFQINFHRSCSNVN